MCTTVTCRLISARLLIMIAENYINSTSNASICINRSRLHVSTLIGSSSGLLFETVCNILKTSRKSNKQYVERINMY